MRGDWKSADEIEAGIKAEIEADIKAGEVPNEKQMILDLWRRVDELLARTEELERRLEGKSN